MVMVTQVNKEKRLKMFVLVTVCVSEEPDMRVKLFIDDVVFFLN